jgi:zinc transporter ZupT
MFLGGIPEAAGSAAMLRRAGYRPSAIFALWSTVILAGILAAAAGKAFIGSSDAIFSQALAGGAVLALVAHAMIPESINAGGRLWCCRLSQGSYSHSTWRSRRDATGDGR